ncbi:MAG: hypothetical protein R2713_01860 [Ilumatobacteraceae bacterium]
MTLPWTRDLIWTATQAHFAAIMGAGISAVAAEHGSLLNDYTRAFAASMVSDISFYEGMELEGHLYEPLGELFDTYDVVVCPTMATDGFVAGQPYVDGPFLVGGVDVGHHILMCMTLPFNLFSAGVRSWRCRPVWRPTVCRPACRSWGEPTTT